MREETVIDVMGPSSATVPLSATVTEVALKMLDEHVRQIPVVDQYGRPAGVIRADDLSSIEGDSIEPAIRPATLVVPGDMSSLHAIGMMREAEAEHAIVVDGDRVVGMLNWVDVMHRFSDC